MMKPNTPLSVAARSEAPKLKRYEANARRSSSTSTNSPHPIVPVLATSAASGISTIALRKNVENPSVTPKPGRIEGTRMFIVLGPASPKARSSTHPADLIEQRAVGEMGLVSLIPAAECLFDREQIELDESL